MAPPFLPQAVPQFPGNADLTRPLALLGDTIGQAMQDQRKQSLLASVLQPGPDGKVDLDKAALGLLQIDPQLANAVASMGQNQFSRGIANAKLQLARDQKSQEQNTVYGTPIYGTDAQGNTLIGTFDKSGGFRQIQTPGFTPTPGVKMLDTGTGFVPVQSRTGQPVPGATYQPNAPAPSGAPPPSVGYIPKDVAGEAREKKVGTDQGETQSSLSSMQSKMPGLERVVTELNDLAEKATYTATGQLVDRARRETGMEPREAALARTRYIAVVDNQVLPLLRDTFGAAFTEREGASLRATLGDPDKTPKEKKAVLDAFINQKRRDVEALELRTKGSRSPSSGGPKPAGGVIDYRSYFGGR